MYEEHFGLSQLPFTLTPNTEFYLNARSHQQAFNLLTVALGTAEGFIKIVGEVGTGKTMLCRYLLNNLDEHYSTAYIPNPYLSPSELYYALADELGVDMSGVENQHAISKRINQKLVELVGAGKQVVLVVDEAQTMPLETMEALRLITNLETEKTKLLQIVLFGQPELDVILSNPMLRQLRQRITFDYNLQPLTLEGASNYVQHRINVAGYNGESLVTRRALKTLYLASGGVPRLINILCHKALMSAYGKGDREVGKVHLLAAIDDTAGVKRPAWYSMVFA